MKNAKTLKKELNEELVEIAWHPKDTGIFACQKMRKKEKEPIFLLSNPFSLYFIREYWNILSLDIVQESLWIYSHFDTWYSSQIFVNISNFDVVQFFFLFDFLGTFVPKYIFENI